MTEKSCDNCVHKEMESLDPNGNRIVDCDANEFQIFMPFAEDCVRWEKKADE